ncbi:hypothetical protein KM043_007180 [Ampulex compressa]|nr:hypothetical protein KM043_007180 [Ampulex compressa]
MRLVAAAKMFHSIRWAFNWKEWRPCEKEFSYAISCIQLEEKQRLGRFVYKKDVRASLAGRLMMRKFINDYTHIPYDEIVFLRDENNKPILKNEFSNISFNISHQGNYTVLAGETRDIKLGVDVMKLEYTGGRQLSEFFRLMNRTFTTSEWEEITGPVLQQEQIQMFCRHWALKESYVKAIGIGIVIDLKTISFKTNSKITNDKVTIDTTLIMNNEKQNWLFEESLLDSDHCVAVALLENNEAPTTYGNVFEIIDSKQLFAHSISLHSEDLQYTKEYFAKDEQP